MLSDLLSLLLLVLVFKNKICLGKECVKVTAENPTIQPPIPEVIAVDSDSSVIRTLSPRNGHVRCLAILTPNPPNEVGKCPINSTFSFQFIGTFDLNEDPDFHMTFRDAETGQTVRFHKDYVPTSSDRFAINGSRIEWSYDVNPPKVVGYTFKYDFVYSMGSCTTSTISTTIEATTTLLTTTLSSTPLSSTSSAPTYTTETTTQSPTMTKSTSISISTPTSETTPIFKTTVSRTSSAPISTTATVISTRTSEISSPETSDTTSFQTVSTVETTKFRTTPEKVVTPAMSTPSPPMKTTTKSDDSDDEDSGGLTNLALIIGVGIGGVFGLTLLIAGILVGVCVFGVCRSREDGDYRRFPMRGLRRNTNSKSTDSTLYLSNV